MGQLTRLPCEKCGDIKSHAHHEDYDYPLSVIWLCSWHHWERHKEISVAVESGVFTPLPVRAAPPIPNGVIDPISRDEWNAQLRAIGLAHARKLQTYRRNGWTLQRIADKFGVTRQRAHALIRKAEAAE